MYLFVVIAVALAALWMAFERPRAGPADAYARFGTLSFGLFILSTSVFWLFSPGLTARLVPGDSGGIQVAVATQARALVGIGLGYLALVGRRHAPRAACSTTAGPMIYNLVMSAEALAAQFTVLGTGERWLYVAAHFLWSMAFALRLAGTRHTGDVSASDVRTGRGLTAGTLWVIVATALLAGCALFALPYDFMVPGLPVGASNFLAHALHGFGSANIAVALIAYATLATADAHDRALGRVTLLLVCAGYAGLGLYRATQMGPLQVWVRGIALLSVLGAAVLAFGDGWRSRGEDDARR